MQNSLICSNSIVKEPNKAQIPMLRWFFQNECLDLRVFDWQHTGNRYFALLVWMLTCCLCHQDLTYLRCSFTSIKKNFVSRMAPSVEEVEEGGRVGWWGPPTSSIDWCEDNYQVSSMHIWSRGYSYYTVCTMICTILKKLVQILKPLYFLQSRSPLIWNICVFFCKN